MDTNNAFVQKNQSGFTLSELMIALAIGTILISIALPAFSTMLEENRVVNIVFKLMRHLNYARSTAITQGKEINICKSRDGETCETDMEWEDGWIVFEDTSANHKHEPDEPLLLKHQDRKNKLTIDYNGGFGYDDYVVYKPIGITSYNGTFTICSNNNEIQPRAIIIYKGRARISRVEADGDPLTCPE